VVEDVLRGATCPTLVVRSDRVASPAGPLRSVLCAVDFSPASDAAFEHAWSLAASPDCLLTLLHVVRGPGAAGRSMRTQTESNRHFAEAAFQKLQELMPPTDRGTVHARVTMGRVVPEILRAARASRADLVIVGAQSRSRLGRRLFGITRRLLQEAPCPVLAVPTRASTTRNTRRVGASRPRHTYARFGEGKGMRAATA
jgi:nucleotide-binding universal stress UspA family protein